MSYIGKSYTLNVTTTFTIVGDEGDRHIVDVEGYEDALEVTIRKDDFDVMKAANTIKAATDEPK